MKFGDIIFPENPTTSKRKKSFPPLENRGLVRAPSDGSKKPEGEIMPGVQFPVQFPGQLAGQSAVQPRLPLGVPLSVRSRRVRYPFRPIATGSYRLPREVQDRLAAALAPYRNREAAYALAVFLGRFWSVPGRIADAFPIDRRALAEHGELKLTEKRIRTAIRTLEEIGFLDRAVASGSPYKATEDGLRRKPIKFVFGADYAPAFIAANRRAAAARGGHSGERRPIAPENARRPSTARIEASLPKGPKSKSEAEKTVLMGPLVKESGIPPQASEPNPKLESALERLKRAIGIAERDGADGAK